MDGNLFRFVAKALIISVCLLGLAACKLGPESPELLELERMLQDPDVAGLREAPGASRHYQEARQFRQLSREAHSDRKDELSREYAVLGALRYRTAVAISQQLKAKTRLDAANAKVSAINPDLRAANAERNKLVKDIRELEERIAALVREKQAQMQQQYATNPSSSSLSEGSRPSMNEAMRHVRSAEQARRSANAVRADQFAQTLFERADSQLRNALTMVSEHPESTRAIIQTANNAQTLFGEAESIAAPRFEEYQAKMQPQARIESIRFDARNTFGEPFTEVDETGVRIVLAALFERNGAEYRSGTQPLIVGITRMAKEYEEFTINIEGYTARRGDVTENLVTSQLRAHRLREHLVSEGIDAERISTNGFGQDRVRFSNAADKNERLEIVFRRSR